MRTLHVLAVMKAAPFAEREHLNVVIETPSGSRTKYSWDPALEAFRAKKVLPLGMTFPYDFGFVPGTKAGDGDPLDALVLADAPLVTGCIVECRALGAIEARMTEKGGGKPVRNDRLIVVPVASLKGAEWHHLADLGEVLLREITEFLQSYVEREGRTFELVGQVDRAKAIELVKKAA
ncbi:MAG TPA: inorganic diphosphatase [Kofleriaceae bacterium]